MLVEKNIDLTVECLKWGNTPWMLDETKSPLIKKIMDRSKTLEKPYDVTFQLQLPDEWDPSLGKYNVGLSAVVETEKCNPEWVEKCNQMDHIVVPSTFTKNVVKRSGVLMKKIDTSGELPTISFITISKYNSKELVDTINSLLDQINEENIEYIIVISERLSHEIKNMIFKKIDSINLKLIE